MLKAVALVAVVATAAVAFAGPPVTHPDNDHQSERAELKRVPAILDLVRDTATHQHDAWFTDGDFPRAIQSLKVLNKLFPHDYQLVTDLGWMLENVHDEGTAIVVYKEYAKTFPDDPEAAYPEAEFYFRNKLFSKVPPIIEPSLKLKSRPHPNSYRMLARSYEKLGLFEDAKRVLDTYLAIAPTDGQAKANRERITKKLRAAMRPINRRDS
jgi:tetratricopeptide (TPR) repeat protein